MSKMDLSGIVAPSTLGGWSAAAFNFAVAHAVPAAAVRVSTPLANSKAAGIAVFDTLQTAFTASGQAGWPVDAAAATARAGAAKAAGLSRETAVAAMFM